MVLLVTHAQVDGFALIFSNSLHTKPGEAMSDAPQKTLLVADDDAEMRRLVRRTLEKRGFTVIEAKDGEEALSRILELKPDAVVLDVMMPGLSGWEICKYVRAHEELAHVGVLMLTAIGRTVNEMTSPLYGADAALDKPFDVKDLVETMDRVLAARA
jgi:DNA-binding response OmpR family regulator